MIAKLQRYIKGDPSLQDSEVASEFGKRHARGLYLAVIPFVGFFGIIVISSSVFHRVEPVTFFLAWFCMLAAFFYIVFVYRCPRCGTIPTSSKPMTTGVLLFPKKCSKCNAPLLPNHRWGQD